MPKQRDPEKTEVHYLHDFADLNNAHILEVGSGDSRLTWRYAGSGCRVVAIDPNPNILASALDARPQALRDTVSLIRSHAETLPFASGAFDGVILAWSL